MTLYFTPVGTLSEQTRAKAADVNAREAAVTVGFTNIEAVIANTDGSVTTGTGWNSHGAGSYISVKKVSSLVSVSARISANGAPSLDVMTLAAGFRPAAADTAYAAGLYMLGGNTAQACIVNVNTAGLVTLYVTNESGAPPARTSSDEVYFNLTFSTV